METNILDFMAFATRDGAPVEIELRSVENDDLQAILFKVGDQTSELRLNWDDAELLFKMLTEATTGHEFIRTLVEFLNDPELHLPEQLGKPANDY